MLSPETEHHLLDLQANQTNYRPDPEIQRQLGDKVAILLVAPSCGGKNTVMDATTKADDDRFCVMGTITSRVPRAGDNPDLYTYYDHTDDGLAELFARIDTHELVQYAVSPYEPYYVYGSGIGDYPKIFCMGDIFSDAVDPYRSLGFDRVIAISLVTEPDVWLPRFNERFPVGDPNRAGRISHAKRSLLWSLAQQESAGHVWVENPSLRPIGQAADWIIQIAEAGPGPDGTRLRAMAQATLKLLEEMRP